MQQRSITSYQSKVYILGAIVGVVSGFVAIGFRMLILGISILFAIVPQTIGLLGWLLIPAFGGILVAFIVVNYAPEARGHGVPEIMDAYARRGGRIRFRVPLLKSLASAICIGSGGSCGREGPIAQIGGGVGSFIAMKLKSDTRTTKTLVVCGVSSGIAATFNTPLGGTLFGIEVIAGGLVGFSIIPVIISSVISTAVVDTILGSQPSFQAPLFVMSNYLELVLYFMLGLLLGVASVIWTRGFYKVEDLFEKLRGPRLAIPAIGGFVVGILAVIILMIENSVGYVGAFKPGEPYFPAIMGVGYAFIDASLLGTVSLVALAAFGIAKAFATSATLGSGGSGGVFAPTLFIGASLGGSFGLLFYTFFPTVVPEPMAYTLVGMAALFAGSGRAPITCIVIIMEMTNDYSLILPLMIAVSASFLVSSLIERESLYTLKLSRRGINVRRGHYISALREIRVDQVMTKNPTVLSPDMTTAEVLKIVDKTQHTKFPVVDKTGVVVGCLITEDLFPENEDENKQYQVKDLMSTDFLHIGPDCTMDSVLRGMLERNEGHAVVVDPRVPNVMLGFVTKADVLRAYQIAIVRLQEAGEPVEAIDPLETIDIM
ncbi:MAG: chloride channel protein [Candidatus Thorarchaeota archaeon]|nr:chloride channel protein [Candidatus Thorarchaeota archaeon]